MTISDLAFKPQVSGASLFEIGACAEILHGMYSKEDHYRWIQPSEAFSIEGSIATVVKGIRPFASVALPESSAYLIALKTIPGISVVPSLYIKNHYNIYRKGAEHLNELSSQVDKMMQERVAEEGMSKSKSLQRILDSHKSYGKIFNYHPDAIASFEVRIKQMLKEELIKLNEPEIVEKT